MKTYERKQITEDRQVIKSIVCDRCEKQIKLCEPNNWFHGYEGVSLEISAGYGSKHDFVAQENDWKFDVCDNCCEEFLKSFKKNPLTVDLSDDD